MNKFTSSTQYNDFRGSASADRADINDASKWLLDQGLISQNELLVGIDMYVGENHGIHRDPVHITFLVSDLAGFQNLSEMLKNIHGPLPLREITKEINISECLALFKRLNITLSLNGVLDKLEYKITD